MVSISSFSNATIPIPELTQFYSLDGVTIPDDRPYTWSMSVSTLDGFISFKDAGAEGPKEVALAHIPNSGSSSDWRLLNAGWMFADAVLGSGAILRSEPHIKWAPSYDDLVDYRVNVLKLPKYPINAILTGSGDVDLKHPIFNDPDIKTVIITSKVGKARISKSGNEPNSNTAIEVVSENVAFTDDEMRAVCRMLKEKYNVKFLDVTAGGIVIASLMKLKLVDEMRVTIAGQICGDISSTGEKRPNLFSVPTGTPPFTPSNNPHLEFHKLAVFGSHHIFLRNLIRYRH